MERRSAELNNNLVATLQVMQSARANMAIKQAEWAATKANLQWQLRALRADLDGQKKEMEMLSQQLVSKIRQYKTERARAELAESKIQGLREKVLVLQVVKGKLTTRLAKTNSALVEEKAAIRGLWCELHKEQNNKDYLFERLAAEKFARAAAQAKIQNLRDELTARQTELKDALGEVSVLQGTLLRTEQSLEAQINLLQQKEAEWATEMRHVIQQHQQHVQDLESQVEQHKEATETVSQQLVSKIRQLKAERARAELAESKIPPLVESIAHLKDLQKELQSSLASVEAALAAEQAIVIGLRDELSSEQAAKAAVLAALESETVARKAEEVKVASLQEELVEKDTLITQLQESLKVLRKQLSDVVEELAQERLSFERQLADLRQVIVTLGEEHAGAVAKLEAEIAHQREEKETVSMQLVSKIRQLRAERERADAAEADASLLAEKLAVMSARYDAAATELEVTAAELAAAKLRLAKLSLALDEERRTSSELRLTNLATVNRAERAEGRADELAARVALLEGELSEARARILQLEASVSRLESELSALREEFDAFRTEAARLQAEMEAALAKREGELLEAKSILETKDDQGRTLLERLAAGEERERMDAMRIRLLNKQYTAMVATYSDKDLLSTATPPASPLDSPARTPTRTPRRA